MIAAPLAPVAVLWHGAGNASGRRSVEFVQVPESSRPQDDPREHRTYISPDQIAKIEENGPDTLNDGVTVTLSSGDKVEAKGEAAERILGYGGAGIRSR